VPLSLFNSLILPKDESIRPITGMKAFADVLVTGGERRLFRGLMHTYSRDGSAAAVGKKDW